MTKEELEKYAEEKAKKRTKGFRCQDNCEKSYVMGFLDCSRLREKKIAELGERNLQLQKDKGNLTDRVRELEKQIEKMKRCEICKHHSNMSGCSYHSGCEKKCKENGMELFELKEIKEK